MHVYCAFIRPTFNALPFTYQVTVQTALPEDGADERQFASDNHSNSEIWRMKDGTLSFGVMEGKQSVKREKKEPEKRKTNLNILCGTEAVEGISETPNGNWTTYNFNSDTRWRSWLRHRAGRSRVQFPMVSSFLSQYGPGVDAASNTNEHPEYFLGSKDGRSLGLTTLPLLCTDSHDIC